jgi:predicted MPP superfamily phosphohydrolase
MMRRLLGSWIFIAFMLCIDFYVFQALRLVTANLSPKPKWIIYGIYWSFTIAAVLLFFILPNIRYEILPTFIKQYFIPILIGFFIAKLVAAIFLFLDDVRRIFHWLGLKLASSFSDKVNYPTDEITRSVFLSWIGLGIGGSIFGTLLYGFGNKYKYRIEKIKLKFENLPLAFKGLKIIHISDIHSGSLDDKKAVEKGIKQIIDQNPDLILFTGDLVNNEASEMEGLKDIFSKLKAPLGVYSILGNHDYGDYKQWPSKEEKVENLNRLKSTHMEMGWRLLLNEHVVIEKENDTLALIGVENWGAKGNFSKYGDLAKAYEGASTHPFKLLMSHDPSHWDAEVCKKYTDIDLMLAGHTHGMQFGVEIPGFRWSPVQYMYKQWAGLYEQASQKLYINRGFGFLGYPGRVGILPEITLIEMV